MKEFNWADDFGELVSIKADIWQGDRIAAESSAQQSEDRKSTKPAPSVTLLTRPNVLIFLKLVHLGQSSQIYKPIGVHSYVN